MTYEESEARCIYTATELVKIYFSGIDREKVSPEKTLEMCPGFIKETWAILNKIRGKSL